MKKIMIWATMLLTLCACKNNNTTTTEAEELPLPETIEEFIEGLDSLDSFYEHTVHSDSNATSYSCLWLRFHAINFENDSVRDREMTIRDYISKSLSHLKEKKRPQAAKYYEYETHINGVDSIEFILATKALSDSLPENMKGTDFNENFRYYPEFIHYEKTHKDKDTFEWFTYHKEEKTPLKQLTNKEDVQKLVLNLISHVKGVKEIPVKYQHDSIHTHIPGPVSYKWLNKGSKEILAEGSLYEIPVKGEEKLKLLSDLYNALTDLMNTHYAPYMELNIYKIFRKENFKDLKQNIIGLEISNTEGADSAAMAPGLFSLQIGSDGDCGLKILFLNARSQRFYIPKDWMEIKEIHNNEIEWLPGSKYHA